MIKQHQPLDGEAGRLKALDSYNVLDTLPEKEYDAITRLASYICNVPIALISLIDGERQWFKSRVGLDAGETPRADAFCSHTILNNEIFEVSNALEEDLFKDNVFVTGNPHIRFYAGAPLIDPDGHRLGSLCVIDTVPRKLTAEQLDAMRTLADEVMSQLILKKQKRELEESLKVHEEFHNLFNISPEIHYIANADSTIELINNAVTGILGYKPEQAIGRSLWDFVGGKGRDEFVPMIEKAVATGVPFELETQTRALNGEMKWISWCAFFKTGKWYASGRDITYQKKISAELEQLSLVASKMFNGVVISDVDDKIIWTNEAFEKITGYSFADTETKRLPDVILKGNESSTIGQYDENIKKKKSYSTHVNATRKDGQQVWLSIQNSVVYGDDGEIEKYVRIIADITERKLLQKELEILSFAARKSPGGMLIRDNKGEVIWMNEALEEILGYTLEEMKGQAFGNSLMGEDTDLDVVEEANKAEREKRSYIVELKLYRKDKTQVWVSISNSMVFNKAGDIERQVSAIVDITESKKAEKELKMLSLVASNTNSGVIINDSNGEVEWVNTAFEKITGYNINDVRNKQLGDVLKGELTDTSIIKKARELSKNKQSFEVDMLMYRKDGQPMWISVINSVILDKNKDVEKYIEVIIDITAKKEGRNSTNSCEGRSAAIKQGQRYVYISNEPRDTNTT